ncbi:group II intron maturase-specific domain-containing protein [Paenibacillus tyrfis]|uniref:group II intron maturase-specific domain-containing protein n=1 Tax=Paenibacillus tyrfis TaxID=1501230 RepID=UPI0015C605EA
MRTKVREELAPRTRLKWSLKDLIAKMNPIIRGWQNYYAAIDKSMANRFLAKIDWHIRIRLSLWWNKKHKKRKASRENLFKLLQVMGLKTVSNWG